MWTGCEQGRASLSGCTDCFVDLYRTDLALQLAVLLALHLAVLHAVQLALQPALQPAVQLAACATAETWIPRTCDGGKNIKEREKLHIRASGFLQPR